VTGLKPGLNESKSDFWGEAQGVFRFREIPYGDYVLRVSAPNYRGYELKFFVDSDGSAKITVLLLKSAN